MCDAAEKAGLFCSRHRNLLISVTLTWHNASFNSVPAARKLEGWASHVADTHCCEASEMAKNLMKIDSIIFHSVLRQHGARGWLRHCATSRKVAGSIPDEVIGFVQFT
jgi:hypothetical protein